LEAFDSYKSSKHHFYDTDYAEYFSKIHLGQIGFYLYDGEQSYSNQLEALRIGEPFFSENCFIIVDDTNERDPRLATLDFMSGE